MTYQNAILRSAAPATLALSRDKDEGMLIAFMEIPIVRIARGGRLVVEVLDGELVVSVEEGT